MQIVRNCVPLAVATAFILASAASSSRAADVSGEILPPAAPAPAQDGWVFSLSPYLWGAGLQGDVGLFGQQPVDVDMSFGDIFGDLRFGGMMVAEAHNGTWGIFADLIYVDVEAEQTVTRTIAGVPAALSASVETSSLTATIMGEYRVVSQPSGTLDLMAGARIWSVDNDIAISLTAGGAPIAGLSGSDGSTWVDPMLGIRGRFDMTRSWYLTGWGMVGGFGAGSDITWDVLGGVGYQWNDWLSTVVGYRALGVDYEDDGFVYDVVQHGPAVGVVFRF